VYCWDSGRLFPGLLYPEIIPLASSGFECANLGASRKDIGPRVLRTNHLKMRLTVSMIVDM
jgi:hypothetical protein